MSSFYSIVNFIFNVSLYPFKSIHPFWGLLFISVVTAIIMLIIFKMSSNQKKIKEVKTKIKAFILEIVLYKDFGSTTYSSFKNILKYNFLYICLALIPLVVIMIPVIIMLIQMNFRYGYRPLKPGDTARIKLIINNSKDIKTFDIIKDNFFEVTHLPVRIPEKNEIFFEIKILKDGIHKLRFKLEGKTFEKEIAAGKDIIPVSVVKSNTRSFWTYFFNPIESGFKTSLVEYLKVYYPERITSYFSININWLVIYLILSVIIGFSIKGLLGVEI